MNISELIGILEQVCPNMPVGMLQEIPLDFIRGPRIVFMIDDPYMACGDVLLKAKQQIGKGKAPVVMVQTFEVVPTMELTLLEDSETVTMEPAPNPDTPTNFLVPDEQRDPEPDEMEPAALLGDDDDS